jgi:NADH-quinone oxidoreductase subunit B
MGLKSTMIDIPVTGAIPQEHTKDGALGFVMTNLSELVGWGRKYSLHPLLFGLACCAIEQINSGMSRFDIARFGSEVFRASPRQADLLIVSGRVSNKMAPVIRRLYDQMLDPKWVIAMGDCASCGGPFNNYAIIQGVDKIIPVDVYVPGCPPRPEALFFALNRLQDKVQKSDIGTTLLPTSKPDDDPPLQTA